MEIQVIPATCRDGISFVRAGTAVVSPRSLAAVRPSGSTRLWSRLATASMTALPRDLVWLAPARRSERRLRASIWVSTLPMAACEPPSVPDQVTEGRK